MTEVFEKGVLYRFSFGWQIGFSRNNAVFVEYAGT